jgi:hypothetical protein
MRSLLYIYLVSMLSCMGNPGEAARPSQDMVPCQMTFYYDIALGSSFTFVVTMEGADSNVTGYSPSLASVLCREVTKPEETVVDFTFILTTEEANELCEFVAKSEIFNLPAKRSFGNENDALVMDGCWAEAELDYRGTHKKVTRIQSSFSLPFDSMRNYLMNLKKGQAAEPRE